MQSKNKCNINKQSKHKSSKCVAHNLVLFLSWKDFSIFQKYDKVLVLILLYSIDYCFILFESSQECNDRAVLYQNMLKEFMEFKASFIKV